PSLLPSFALFHAHGHHRDLHSFPTRRSSDLPSPRAEAEVRLTDSLFAPGAHLPDTAAVHDWVAGMSRRVWMRTQRAALDELDGRSEEHTSELQSRENLVCRLLLEKKKKKRNT